MKIFGFEALLLIKVTWQRCVSDVSKQRINVPANQDQVLRPWYNPKSEKVGTVWKRK